MSNCLLLHGLQHSRLPYPSPSPGVCSNLCPLSQWCHLIISFSVVPFSSCLEFFPASGSFSVSQLPSVGQSIGSFSFSISLSNEYSRLISFRIDWFDLFPVQRTLKSLLPHHSSKASFLWCSAFFMVSHIHTWLLEKPQLCLYGSLSAKWWLYFSICCQVLW